MEKGLFHGHGDVLAPGAPSWDVQSRFSCCWICGLPLPLLQQVLGCSPSLSLWPQMPGWAWGYRICESVISWCLLRSYSNFPTIKSAVEFECSALCCVSVLD